MSGTSFNASSVRFFPKIKLLKSESETSQEELVQIQDTVKNMDKISCTQWIVITTISLPTDDIKYIHDSSFDWCVVVVADKKTPVNWSYKLFFSAFSQMCKNRWQKGSRWLD
jgi:hypothetical protein